MGMRRVLSLGREKYHRDKTVQSAYSDIYLISGTQKPVREREREEGSVPFLPTDPFVPYSTHTRAHPPRYRGYARRVKPPYCERA